MRLLLALSVIVTAGLPAAPAEACRHPRPPHQRSGKAARCPYGPAPTLVATSTPPCRAVPLP